MGIAAVAAFFLAAAFCAHAKETTECPAGEHAPDIVTYTLVGGRYLLFDTDDNDANTIILEVDNGELPAVAPYFVNEHDGFAQQGLLNTNKFLDTWSAFNEGFEDFAKEYGKGAEHLKHAGPALALGAQCRISKDYISSFSYSYSSFSLPDFSDIEPMARSNAMLITAPDPTNAHLVFIDRVERLDGVTRFHLEVLANDAQIVAEGSCHQKQSDETPHFHHMPACSLVEIAKGLVLPLGKDEAFKTTAPQDRTGFTLNVKLLDPEYFPEISKFFRN